MTAGARQGTFGPAEAEAAAARLGLRVALNGGLTARHAAPLAIFTLTLLFASTLALTGFISRRAGEATIMFAAGAFMVQRAATRWRIRRARQGGRAAIAQLHSAGALTAAFEEDSLSLEGAGRTLRLNYADCEEAENAGGLIYVWPREGVPIVVPTRALADAEEEKRLVARLAGRIRRSSAGHGLVR